VNALYAVKTNYSKKLSINVKIYEIKKKEMKARKNSSYNVSSLKRLLNISLGITRIRLELRSLLNKIAFSN